MTLQQKIKAACELAGITLTELAEEFGTSQQNFSQRLKVGKFTQEELERIAKILHCTYKSGFYFSNGSIIE